jgi:hypothetical protein
MALAKATLFFQIRNSGWSESFYSSKTDLHALLDSAKTLALARSKMLGSDASITYIRVSVEGVFRDAQVSTNAMDGPQINAECAPTKVRLQMRLVASDTTRRIILLGGIPAGQITAGQYRPLPSYVTKVNLFRNQLISGTWGIRAKDATDNPDILIPTADPSQGVITINVVAAPFYQKQVVIRGGRAMGPFVGVWRVFEVPLQPLKLQLYRFPPQPATPANYGPGLLRLNKVAFAQFINSDTELISSRPTGRPFGQPVGRRRRVR